jgi:hypothetical protein
MILPSHIQSEVIQTSYLRLNIPAQTPRSPKHHLDHTNKPAVKPPSRLSPNPTPACIPANVVHQRQSKFSATNSPLLAPPTSKPLELTISTRNISKDSLHSISWTTVIVPRAYAGCCLGSSRKCRFLETTECRMVGFPSEVAAERFYVADDLSVPIRIISVIDVDSGQH